MGSQLPNEEDVHARLVKQVELQRLDVTPEQSEIPETISSRHNHKKEDCVAKIALDLES